MIKTPRQLDIDRDAVLKDAMRQLGQPARRLFLQRSLTLGGLSMLTGCSLTDGKSVEKALASMSRFNDDVQARLFDPERLAPTYTDEMITRPFPFNAYYGIDKVRHVDAKTYTLEVSGLVADKHAWTLDELNALAQADQITRHICVEGWS